MTSQLWEEYVSQQPGHCLYVNSWLYLSTKKTHLLAANHRAALHLLFVSYHALLWRLLSGVLTLGLREEDWRIEMYNCFVTFLRRCVRISRVFHRFFSGGKRNGFSIPGICWWFCGRPKRGTKDPYRFIRPRIFRLPQVICSNKHLKVLSA